MSDQVIIKLVEGPLLPAGAGFDAGVGARLVFEGIVRPIEQGEPIEGLLYEAYEPMTSRELTRLAEATLQTHGLIGLKVEHSVGKVAAGEVSFRLTLHSAHRKESLQAAEEFINQMKQGVPLWKTPIKA